MGTADLSRCGEAADVLPPPPPQPEPSGSSSACPCRRNRGFWRGLKVLELGSGTGWLALRLAAHGAAVTATDRSGTLALLSQNVVKNQVAFSSLPSRDDDYDYDSGGGEEENENRAGDGRGVELDVTVAPLEWKSPVVVDENDDDANSGGDTSCLERTSASDVPARDLGGDDGWDAILAGDVLYLNELYMDLLRTLREQCSSRDRLLRGKDGGKGGGAATGGKGPTVVVIAWEERRPKEEARFAELASEMGFVFWDDTPRVVGANAATQNRMWVVTMSLGPRLCATTSSKATQDEQRSAGHSAL